MAHKSDQENIERTRSLPRFFVEHPQISWVLLVGVLAWGWFGYTSMPQRKDPEITVRVGVATCAWPGASSRPGRSTESGPRGATITIVYVPLCRHCDRWVSPQVTTRPKWDATAGGNNVSLPGTRPRLRHTQDRGSLRICPNFHPLATRRLPARRPTPGWL